MAPEGDARAFGRRSLINLSTDDLSQTAVERSEAVLANGGALVAQTFERTGRSPNDKFIVRSGEAIDNVWWGPNQPIEPSTFEALWSEARRHLGQRDVFVTDSWACADPTYRIGIEVVSELAWHALFARQLFRRPTDLELSQFSPDWTVLSAPNLKADPSIEGVNSEVFVGIDFSSRRVLIVGTHYAGELKKSIFTVLNYLLPAQGVLPMHCSANVGPQGDVALFFGLSGTGKTTLSTHPARRLIGDDEHGWSSEGVFNFEGGCYAKCIRLSREKEPQIYAAIRSGAVVENVVLDPKTGEVDYDDDSITENTRVAYPLDFIEGAVPEGRGGHAATIVFLTADASGVLPPIAKLQPAQAAYHFLSGYTSKLAGTESGLGSDPQSTFSTCFGAPFLPRPPTIYADMLMQRIAEHRSQVFLVNTGWCGGSYGVGSRIDLEYTRAIVAAAISGSLEDVSTTDDPVFGFKVPDRVDSVPDSILKPRSTWNDPLEYDAKAKELAAKFVENFEKLAPSVDKTVRHAGPVV